jgi:hypothetical protein
MTSGSKPFIQPHRIMISKYPYFSRYCNFLSMLDNSSSVFVQLSPLTQWSYSKFESQPIQLRHQPMREWPEIAYFAYVVLRTMLKQQLQFSFSCLGWTGSSILSNIKACCSWNRAHLPSSTIKAPPETNDWD